jgi:hypothetical protein
MPAFAFEQAGIPLLRQLGVRSFTRACASHWASAPIYSLRTPPEIKAVPALLPAGLNVQALRLKASLER